MKYKHVFFISPPFYSHFRPLLVLAKSFEKQKIEVTFGCSLDFKKNILNENLSFYEIDISKNRNTGQTGGTIQPESERLRLEEFFESTKKGAIETLMTQAKHRQADMLANPEELIVKIKGINDSMAVDCFVVDILSYGVSLSLYSLDLPFITFCPPHPHTIPDPGTYYGVPEHWPTTIKPKDADLTRLKQVSLKTESEFTAIFNRFIAKNKGTKKIENAFRLVSPTAIIYNYFDFYNDNQGEKPAKLFIGNCFNKESLDQNWLKIMKTNQKKVMITFGTFLSNRKDVLEKLLRLTREIYPQALLILSAGSNVEALKKYRSANTLIEGFIPQIALMPYIDTVIFHGGCNTFTEAMYYGKEMIILPFSSDQFSIAYDVEKNKLGAVLDPNNFTKDDLDRAFELGGKCPKNRLTKWSNLSKARGPDYAVERLISPISNKIE